MNRMSLLRSIAVSGLMAAAGAVHVAAQTGPPYPTKFSAALAERPEVKQALSFIDERFDRQVTEWIAVTEIPAPSTREEKRAAYVKTELEKLGLTVTIDAIGNVMARRVERVVRLARDLEVRLHRMDGVHVGGEHHSGPAAHMLSLIHI